MSGDALPDTSRPLTDDERIRLACDWSDYRSDYGIPSFTTREGRVAYYAFVAGWKARNNESGGRDGSRCESCGEVRDDLETTGGYTECADCAGADKGSGGPS